MWLINVSLLSLSLSLSLRPTAVPFNVQFFEAMADCLMFIY